MPRDYKQFFAICKRHGFEYKDKVAEFTKDRTDSLSSLSDGEYHELLTWMLKLNAPARQRFIPKPGDEMRKKIIAIARQMKWEYKSHPAHKPAPDMNRINHWCLKHGKFHKPLNEHTPAELTLLVTIFERVYHDYLTVLNS